MLKKKLLQLVRKVEPHGDRKSREIKEGLIKKGFLPEQRDHTYLFLHVEGRKSSVRTKVSHGSKEYWKRPSFDGRSPTSPNQCPT